MREDGTPVERGGAIAPPRGLRTIFGLALVLRLLVFAGAENKQGDAPMRVLLAERMNEDAAAASDARSFRQFGPLPLEAMRPFLALGKVVGGEARGWSRVPSLLAGLAVFPVFFSLARRLTGGGPAVALAGLALALSPLHIQASTTATSEALYLLLLVAACERLHAALSARRRVDFVLAGVLLSLTAVTRYDAWVALPALVGAALLWGPRDRRAVVDLGLLCATTALFPVAFLWWSWRSSGDPFFVVRFISQTHATVAAEVSARLGPVLSRLRQVVVWSESFAAAMTPVALVAGLAGARHWRRLAPATCVVAVTALAPIAAYLAKGLLLGGFEPLPRFALAPGVILLPLAVAGLPGLCAAWGWRRPALPLAAGALGMNALVMLLAFAQPGRIKTGAEALAPLTRLDAEDRALAEHLRRHRAAGEGVVIDTMDYADIAIAHAAGIPWSHAAGVAWGRSPPRTLARSRIVSGAAWFAVHDLSWGRALPLDWPPDSLRLGGWRVVHLSGATGVTPGAN